MEQPAQDKPRSELQRLLRAVREAADGLRRALWTERELADVEAELGAWQRAIDSGCQEIVDNLYWFERVGWKTYVPDPGRVKQTQREARIRADKERLYGMRDALHRLGDGNGASVDPQAEEELLRRVAEAADHKPGQARLLDIGCGNGSRLRRLASLGMAPDRLAGVELAQDPVDRLRRSDPAFAVRCAFPDELPYAGGMFDAVLLTGILSFIAEPELRFAVAAECARLLAADGLLFVCDWSPQAAKQLEPWLAFQSGGLAACDVEGLFPAPEWRVSCNQAGACTLAVVSRRNGRETG